MEDTSEFLLRLLSTMQNELEAGWLAANPVSDSFQLYVELHMRQVFLDRN